MCPSTETPEKLAPRFEKAFDGSPLKAKKHQKASKASETGNIELPMAHKSRWLGNGFPTPNRNHFIAPVVTANFALIAAAFSFRSRPFLCLKKLTKTKVGSLKPLATKAL